MEIEPNRIDKFMNSIFFKVICIVDTFIGVGSLFFVEKYSVAKIAFIIAFIVMCIIVCAIAFRFKMFIKSEKRNKELENTRMILEKNIHNGIKYTKNEAIITFDKAKSEYRFEFIKEYEIISDNFSKWYSAQFYANKFLNDKDKSKKYYEENPIKWDKLHVRAQISICNPEDNEFSEYQHMRISNVTNESNYIPFKILYTTYRRNRALNIKKGTKVKLKYCYNVPVSLWGSYLNRRISYFGEDTSVILKHAPDTELEIKVSLLSEPSGNPIDINNFKKTKDREGDYDTDCIILEPKPFAKYRIWWDSSEYFEKDSATEDTMDTSLLTND